MGRPKANNKAFALTTSECTGASVVNTTTITYMQDVGSAFLAGNPSPVAVSYYNATMAFLVNIVLNLGVREGSSVSLWDAVTAVILLGTWEGGAALFVYV